MQGADAITKAVQEGDLEQVRTLITAQPALLVHSAAPGIPITLWAAYYRKWEIFEYLMNLKGDPSIYEAAAGGLVEAARAILKENLAMVNAYGSDGFTPLALACYFNRPAVAGLLVEHGANVDLAALNPSKVAPIHSAVAANSIELTKMLLDHDVNVNVVQNGGVTALHSAAHRGNTEIVRLLLDHGADKTMRTDDGFLALDFAEKDGHEQVVVLLK
ncbi:MAG: ankyrin repeat domain-containing protein [Saprospiraceae bacterium]|nr:ankyrin repeat domain-containing protein [Lewinella sp.]